MTDPTRQEVWWADFEPARGSEPRFTRPVVLVGTPAFEHLPVRVVVPFTTWQPRFERQANKLLVPRSDANGLALDSAVDVMLLRSLAIERLTERLGVLELDIFDQLRSLLAVVFDLLVDP